MNKFEVKVNGLSSENVLPLNIEKPIVGEPFQHERSHQLKIVEQSFNKDKSYLNQYFNGR